uniref:E3 ubiquitin-protein ligase n=1 Tax=Megaselia scalaris TaxID=36166 RepID=T1GPI6_MEGSC
MAQSISSENEIIVVDDEDSDEAKETSSKEIQETTDPSDSDSIECPICLQNCIHPAKLPCGHIFCFLCVKVSKIKTVSIN